MNAREKSKLDSLELLVQQEQWLEISPGMYESFVGSSQITWPSQETSFQIDKITISGELVNPHVELVDELPLLPLPEVIPSRNVRRNDLQRMQAVELFEHLIQSGISREEALAMMGPLAAEITKYRYSFSVSEARWTVKGLIGKQRLDRPFMASVTN